MGISAGIAVFAGASVYSARQSRKARQDAERAAHEEREAIRAMQREIQAEAAEANKAIPTPDDDASRRARRRSMSSYSRRRGRQSTMLTGDVSSDSLGN